MSNDMQKLFEGWGQILDQYRNLPDTPLYDYWAQYLAEKGMSLSALFNDIYEHNSDLKDIHYDFGLLETLHGEEAKNLWTKQAQRIRKAKRKYSSTRSSA